METNDSVVFARELVVAKRNDMMQNARYNLTVQEQRVILYAVSQIKPDDKIFQEYEFDIKQFYKICGIEDDSYTRLKRRMKGLTDKSWWITIKDEKGKSWQSVVRWFSTLALCPDSGIVKVKFHEHMMPYLLQLAKQNQDDGIYYTTYDLKYVLPMQSKFSIRLYEILKSYQINNIRWFFQVEDLQMLLCDCDEDKKSIIPKTWDNFAIFKRDVVEPAMAEINTYTDLKIAYKTEKTGRKVTRIIFGMLEKTDKELMATQQVVNEALNGQVSIEDILNDIQQDPISQFEKSHDIAVRAEHEEKLRRQSEIEASLRRLKETYGGS